jgi:hypothetical protein
VPETSPQRRKTIVAEQPLAWVVPQHGPLEGQVFPVSSGASLGAAPDVHIRLEGYIEVADVHARLVWKAGWHLVNMTSPETRVGDRSVLPLETRQIDDGDIVVLGSACLVFRSFAW